MRLNPIYQDKIADKRILVMDDFITDGYSGEWARTLLLEAGASEVICVGVGKFPRRGQQPFMVQSPRPGVHIDPFGAAHLGTEDFDTVAAAESKTATAQSELLQSFAAFQCWY